MGPAYARPDCQTCIYLDSFLGSDWYLCSWGYPGSLVRVRSLVPHDMEVRPATRPTGGPWMRAFMKAQAMGLVAPEEK